MSDDTKVPTRYDQRSTMLTLRVTEAEAKAIAETAAALGISVSEMLRARALGVKALFARLAALVTSPVPAGAGGVDSDAIRARCEAATKPTGGDQWIVERHAWCGDQWIVERHAWSEVYSGPLSADSTDIASHIYRHADAEFIAHARSDVPALLAALAAAEQRADTAAERLSLARHALVASGYFTEDQVGEDVAPRITEMVSALSQRANTAEAAIREVEKLADPIDAGERRYPDRIPRRVITVGDVLAALSSSRVPVQSESEQR